MFKVASLQAASQFRVSVRPSEFGLRSPEGALVIAFPVASNVASPAVVSRAVASKLDDDTWQSVGVAASLVLRRLRPTI
jgi:hypothetical protein